jgi:hypothetical protein
MKKSLLAIVLVLVAASRSSAALVITEVMSSSGATGTPDWFELTNTGVAAANITGFKMDDISNSFAASQFLLGVTSIAAGESALCVETDKPASALPAFRSFWSAAGLASVQIGSYSGSQLGLSSTADQVHVFDAGGAAVADANFLAATPGVSFGYNPTTATFGAISVAGQFGAFVSADALHNVGSPGTIGVPEPAALALAGCALIAGGPIRRRRPSCTYRLLTAIWP